MIGNTPLPNELEISLFGPGVGECIVIHLGNGRWMVVDSCLEQGEPVASRYLSRIGVQLDAVVCVVLSHWHDDHIRGASSVLASAPNAEMVCAAALRGDEFKTLLNASQFPLMQPSGVDEFVSMLQTLRARGKGRKASIGPRWVLDSSVVRSDETAKVTALSPSSGSLTLAMHEIGRLVPRPGPKKRFVSQRPNALSVVLWIEAGDARVLLGGDLEHSADSRTGWQAIVDSNVRPQHRAHAIKVPHHGSANADHPGVWERMLENEPVALLTPYNAGRKPLPTTEDRARLRARTQQLYLTSEPGGRKSRRPEVDRTIRAVALELREVAPRMGHIRLRVPMAAPSAYRVDTFGAALRIA